VKTSTKPGPIPVVRQIAAPISIVVEPASLDIKSAAAFLSCSVRQIRTLIYSRELIPVWLGDRQVLLVEDLREFIRAKRKAA
jgi:hypothetical protein